MWPFPNTPEYTTLAERSTSTGYICSPLPPPPPPPTPEPIPSRIRAVVTIEIASPDLTGEDPTATGDPVVLVVPDGATRARVAFSPPTLGDVLRAAPIDDAGDPCCRAITPGGQLVVRPLWVRLTGEPVEPGAVRSTLVVIFEDAAR
jgi:hypothetical protein